MNDLKEVLDNEAGGTVSFRNDSLVLEGDITISHVHIELKDIAFDAWTKERGYSYE